MFFSRSKNLVGLDIGDNSIKVVELKELSRGKAYSVTTLADAELSPEAIVDGAIMDSGLVIETIQRLWRDAKIRSNQVATALSGHSVIIKRVSLPVMSEDQLAESIPWEAETYIPFDIDDVNIDYQVLEGSSLSGEGNMDVLLVAVKKETINDYTSVIGQAGMTPAVVDVDAFALQNCFQANYDPEPGKTVALIDIGASVSTISILQGGTSVFWRDLSMGGNQYTDAIQKELNLSSEHAERLKRGEEVDGIPFEKVVPILSAVTHDLGDGIQKTVDFFKATAATDEPLEAIYLTGGTSRVHKLEQSLNDRFGSQVEILNPFRRISPAGGLTAETLGRGGSGAAVAVGLALRKAGDR
jgi:type IV pilus assembly protein PilM